jgi:primosomal protein N' (replication factor Y)
LIIAPDDKDVEQIVEALRSVEVAVLRLSSSMTRDERYESFLECQNQILKIVVGTRSSVFAPIDNLSTILVYKESSSDHYEIRSPGWNSRAVAMIRSELQGQNIVFLGYSPSVEVALLIDSGKVVFRPHAAEVKTISFTPDSGTLLPGRIFSEIRNALKDGPVLFLAARKGYGNALLCSHCRNIARCECGGRLHVGAKSTPPTCAHCGEIFNQWKCKFCNRNTQYLAGRGIERASEEISRAFPGYPVVFSAGDVIKENVENRPSLILSTPGAQPKVQGGYATVVILDAMRFFSHTDLRSQERAREIIFESVSLLSKNGKALLVIDSDHPIVPAVTRWNVVTLMKRELSERREINLPPFVSSAVLLVPESEAASISSGLRRACNEGRLPDSLVIYGPTPVAKNQCKLVLHASISDSKDLYSFLFEFQKKRSISKKELVTIRVEPYSL